MRTGNNYKTHYVHPYRTQGLHRKSVISETLGKMLNRNNGSYISGDGRHNFYNKQGEVLKMN